MTKETKEKSRRIFGIVLNVVSVALIGFTLTTVVARRAQPVRSSKTASLIKLNQKIAIPQFDAGTSPRTLVVALSTACRYCTESAPFYRELLRNRHETDWQAVGLLPQPVEAARDYMARGGYMLPHVRQLNLGAIGIMSTPTLLLLDQQGRVQQMWIGKLSPEDEADVAAQLGITTWAPRTNDTAGGLPGGAPTYSPLVTSREFVSLLRRPGPLNVVDVRDRGEFAQGSIRGAVNIPADELAVRAAHELLVEAPIVLYCEFSAACAAGGVPSLCSHATDALQRVGFTNVRIARDQLRLLEVAGVPIEGAAGGRTSPQTTAAAPPTSHE